MGVSLVRGLLGGLGVVLMVAGVLIASMAGAGGDLFGALFLFLPGALLVAGVILERTRYRSLHAERTGDGHGRGGGEVRRPEPRFQPTDEVFADPTSGALMRVFVDPGTGERRYVAEG